MNNTDKKVLVINGSLRGSEGNSHALSNIAAHYLQTNLQQPATVFTLTDCQLSIQEVYALLEGHDAFLIVTGVYWNNWSSPLQRFIEVATPFEHSPAFFGKPVACAVTMDSVGGIEIAARLHGVFSGLGCWSPPCSTLVLSRVGQEAIEASQNREDDPNEDVWRLSDLHIVLNNLITATSFTREHWVAWPHIELPLKDGPWPESGPLNLNTPVFL